MTTAAVVGSTGMVGSQILSQLLAHPSYASIHAFARRDLPNPTASPKLHSITSPDNSTWATQYPATAAPKVFYSALGTTRATAGSLEAQRKIDLDLNFALAQAAKAHGADTYVLVSAASANAASMFAYPALKGELEDKVVALGFRHTVIVRPGLIMGARQETRMAEGVVRGIAGALKAVSPRLTDFWGQDASAIAKAAIVAGTMCVEGKREGEGVWVLNQADIVRMGAEGAK